VVLVALVEIAVLAEAGVHPEAAFLAVEAAQAGFVVVEAVEAVTVDHSVTQYILLAIFKRETELSMILLPVSISYIHRKLLLPIPGKQRHVSQASRFDQMPGCPGNCKKDKESGSSNVGPSKKWVFTANPGDSGYDN